MDTARTVEDPPAGARAPPPGAPRRAPRPPTDPDSTGRYRPDRIARPPRRKMRAIRAYWVTMLVIGSYVWLRLRARFHSEAWIDKRLIRVHIRNARRIERGICALQGLFIKVGQLISIMTNFLPDEFRKELEGLQDAVPPRPYADMEQRIREELQASPDELFATFDRQPIASASIGQVHVATLHSGETVAVKVQYPDIDEIVKADLRTLRRIFKIVQRFLKYDGLDELYREIRVIVLAELDFTAEADNGDRIAANFEGRRDVAFPTVVRSLSTARILTTHFEKGVKISDHAAVKRLGLDRKVLAHEVVRIYCQQIFTDGVYHADPHPGNLLVRPGDKPGDPPCIVFLDFGAVAEISPAMREGIVEVLQGALTRDSQRIVKAMKQMGFVARGADERVFEQVVEYFHTRFQESISLESFNLKEVRFDPDKGLESIADLRKMDLSIRDLSANFHVPKEFIVLERTLLLLMGLCTELDPQLEPMTVIRPYVERFVLGDEGDWSQLLVETSKDLMMSVTALPAEVRKFLRAAHTGDLQLRFKNLDPAANLMYRLGHQVIFALVGISAAAIALVLEGRGELPRAEYAWWTARGAGVCLVWSWWTSRGFLKRKR
jgi:predicted unusual protein kinase regulating ubiquinone biosynthesis (AarF/ABC1/UbiB family)